MRLRILIAMTTLIWSSFISVQAAGQLMQDAPAGPRADQFEKQANFVCDDERHIRLENVRIEGEGDGIMLSGECRLTLVDSRIDTTGWAIKLSDGASLKVRHSHVRGDRGAFSIEDAARIHASKSIFEGSSDSKGEATFHDEGGNRRATAGQDSAGPSGDLDPTKPANCTGREGELVIENKIIDTEKHAVLVQGNCKVTIRNCHVKAKDRAVVLQGGPQVTIEETRIESEGRALIIVGEAEVTIRNSHVVGRIQKVGKPVVRDEGSNVYE